MGERLLAVIIADPYNRATLTRMNAHVTRPKKFVNARAMQQDAVALAIKSFGGDGAASELALPGRDTALAAVRLHEDAVIEHNARWIRGLDGHYLRSNGFVELVHSGYIGTRGATTEHLRVLIDEALDGGRAVVAAIQTRLEDAG